MNVCNTETEVWQSPSGLPTGLLLENQRTFSLTPPSPPNGDPGFHRLMASQASFAIEQNSSRLQDPLREPEELFRVAARYSNEVMFVWDTRCDRFELLGAVHHRLGLTKDEIPTSFSDWLKLIHPADVERINKGILAHYQTRDPFKEHFRILRKDGIELSVEVRGSTFWNRSGDCSKWIGVITDLSERKLNEEAISQLNSIVQSSEDAIVICDLDNRIVKWNMGAQALYGYSAQEIIGQPLAALVPGGSDETLKALDGIRNGSSAIRLESVHLTKHGSCAVSVGISPVRLKTGKLHGFALISYSIGDRKLSERQLVHQTLHDSWTGLPNRRLLRDRLQQTIFQAAQENRLTGLFVIGLDGFKAINDTLGHSAGDQILKKVAARLSTCARPIDTLGRAGGDEFRLVAGSLTDSASVRILTARLMECLKEPFEVNGSEVVVRASIGVAVFPNDGADADLLQRNADAAMFHAKHSGRNRVQFFNQALGETIRERVRIEDGLRHALQRNEFSLNFQPVFAAADKGLRRFEALLRWKPSFMPGIGPAQFIPVAEETGLIVPIGNWVLLESCRVAAAWQNGPRAGIGIAVNVSAVQLARPDFIETVTRVLNETGLPPNLLELELTESMFIREPDETARTIAGLNALGLTIAIDDFGTGYSSLSYLKNLPVHALKIDKSFLSEVETNSSAVSMIKSIVALAHCLSMRVVVEGVETQNQCDIVSGAGCDDLQGYLLGRPAAAPVFG